MDSILLNSDCQNFESQNYSQNRCKKCFQLKETHYSSINKSKLSNNKLNDDKVETITISKSFSAEENFNFLSSLSISINCFSGEDKNESLYLIAPKSGTNTYLNYKSKQKLFNNFHNNDELTNSSITTEKLHMFPIENSIMNNNNISCKQILLCNKKEKRSSWREKYNNFDEGPDYEGSYYKVFIF